MTGIPPYSLKPDALALQHLRQIGSAPSPDPQQLISFVCEGRSNAIFFNESSTRIDFPGASVEWSVETATLYLELLSRVPMAESSKLAALAMDFASRSIEIRSHVAASRAPVNTFLRNERQRIEALLPKKTEEKPPATPASRRENSDSEAPGREAARQALDTFDILAGELREVSVLLMARLEDLENWWKLAEVARSAQQVVDRHSRSTQAAGPPTTPLLAHLRAAVARLWDVLNDPSLRRSGFAIIDPRQLVQLSMTIDTTALAPQVDEFLESPWQEAWASFKRMLDNVGTHPLLSLGALGGLVGLFAYVRALTELSELQLSPVNLVTSGDITDFALRLAPVFLLSSVAALSIIAFCVVALACNQRQRWRFAGALVLCTVVLVLVYTWLIRWTSPTEYWPPDVLSIVLGSALLAVLVPVAMVLKAGWTRGIREDDVWQQFILKFLRLLSDSKAVLSVFAVLGIALLASPRFSVLFAKGSPEGPQLVVETKLYEPPILIDPKFSRLGTQWIVQRIGTTGVMPWSIIPSSEVVCVRPRTQEEIKAGSLTNSCTNSRPPAAFLPDTIAGYATAFYRCDRKSFGEQRPIAVMRFDSNLPRSNATIVTGPMFRLTAEKLAVPGLDGLLGEQQETAFGFIETLRRDPHASLLVLGFASTTGDSANNANLSERRALALWRSLLTAAGHTENEVGDLTDRIHRRGLGEDLLSGLFGTQDAIRDQVAVAFLCDRR